MSISSTSANLSLDTKRHSFAHIMACAVQIYFREMKMAENAKNQKLGLENNPILSSKVQFGVGPVIEKGCYYDFILPRNLVPEDLPKIEKIIQKLLKQDLSFKRVEVSLEEGMKIFTDSGQPLKVELLENLRDKGTTSLNEEDKELFGNTSNYLKGAMKIEEIIIRSAKVKDAGDCIDICNKCWVETYPNSQIGLTKEMIIKARETRDNPVRLAKWQNLIKEDLEKITVAEINNKVVGYIGVKNNEIKTFYIDSDYRVKGIGTKLMQSVLAKKEYENYIVEVTSYNQKAISFYEKCGFKFLEKSDDFIFNENIKLPQNKMIFETKKNLDKPAAYIIEKSLSAENFVKLSDFGEVKIDKISGSWGELVYLYYKIENENNLLEFLKNNLLEKSENNLTSWYAEVGTKVVFKNKIIDVKNEEGFKEFQEYGQSLGIPKEELDILIGNIDKKTAPIITIYQIINQKTGEILFEDLCKGPHIQKTKREAQEIRELKDKTDLEIQKSDSQDKKTLFEIMQERSNWLEEKQIRQWIYPLTLENFEKYTKNKDVYKVLKNQEIVGMFIAENSKPDYYPEKIVDKQNTWYLSKIITKLSEKDSGLGVKMLQAIENYAEKQNLEYLRLDCVYESEFLTKFYVGNGFDLIFEGRKKDYKFDKFDSKDKTESINYFEKKINPKNFVESNFDLPKQILIDNESLILRIAAEIDAQKIIQLKKQVLPNSFGKILGLSTESIEKEHGKEAVERLKDWMKLGKYIVAQNSKQEIIGVAAACNDGEIRTFYVRGDYQNKGIGTKILKECVNILAEKYDSIKIGTLVGNEKAIKLYKNLGFEEYERVDYQMLFAGKQIPTISVNLKLPKSKIKEIQTNNSLGFSLDKFSASYWRGDQARGINMQRLYALVFETKEELETFKTAREEAKKFDHRVLGQELDLFSFSDLVGSGLPLFSPKGTLLRNTLKAMLFQISKSYGCLEVTIPHMAKIDLYETSGHAKKFAGELFHVKSHYDIDFVLKPVNCPHHTQIFASKMRSYRDLPLRYIESTMQYRDEKPGAIGGLTRVRAITCDDGHTFCTPDQIKGEILSLCKTIEEFYTNLGMYGNHWVSISVRDYQNLDNYTGFAEDWDKAENMLKEINSELGLNGKVCEGEAAIYGPKLDFMYKDIQGNERQLSTVQLDFATPKRFGLTYKETDGTERPPVMIHRAILGSYERFLAILLESTKGRFPFWLAPVQLKILTINNSTEVLEYVDRVKQILAEIVLMKPLKYNEIRFEIDDRQESLGKKIREGEMQKVPVLLIVGPKDILENQVSVRTQNGEEKVRLEDLESFLQQLN
jgi:threonyl-tRNA synthetase